MLHRLCVLPKVVRFRYIVFCLVFAHQMPVRAEAATSEATSSTVEAYRFALEVLEFPLSVEQFETTLNVNSRLPRVVGTDKFTLYAISNKLIAEGLVGIIAYTDPKDGRIVDASVFFYSDSLRTRFIAEPFFSSRGILSDIAARRKQELRINFKKSKTTAIAFAEEHLKQTEVEPSH